MHEDRTPAEHQEEHKRRATFGARLIVALILLVLFLWFVASNSRRVRVEFFFAETLVALYWVFLACALVGALVAYLLGRPGRRNTRKYIRELERRVHERDES